MIVWIKAKFKRQRRSNLTFCNALSVIYKLFSDEIVTKYRIDV